MKIHALFFAAIAMLLGACGTTTVVAPYVPSAVAGTTFEVAPPYHDPEFVLYVTMPNGMWDERRAIDGGSGRPDAVAVLTRRSDGITAELLFVPSFDHVVSDVGNAMRADYENREPGSCTNVVVWPNGADAAFSATINELYVAVQAFRMDGMTKSFGIIRVTAPVAKARDASNVLTAVRQGLVVARTGPLTPKERLAQCLSDKGVVLYETSYCGPCRLQLQWFGEGASRLNHIQCDDEGPLTERDICKKADLHVFPTWIFSDGSRIEASATLDDLAEKSGCPKLSDK